MHASINYGTIFRGVHRPSGASRLVTQPVAEMRRVKTIVMPANGAISAIGVMEKAMMSIQIALTTRRTKPVIHRHLRQSVFLPSPMTEDCFMNRSPVADDAHPISISTTPIIQRWLVVASSTVAELVLIGKQPPSRETLDIFVESVCARFVTTTP